MITSNNPPKAPQRGAFILLEGVDRCGKTTQVSLLVKHLISLSLATVAYRFPDRTTQGEKRRSVMHRDHMNENDSYAYDSAIGIVIHHGIGILQAYSSI